MQIKDIESAYIELLNECNVGLAEYFSVNPLYCTNEDFYKQYLQFNAIFDMHSGNTATHVFVDKKANRIMGYISLRANSIVSKDDKSMITGKPSLEISVLAVDKDYEHQGVGTVLMAKALEIASTLHEKYIGVKHLILAADPNAVGFYEKMGFRKMASQWEQIPAESFSGTCVPMCRDLAFELENLESFVDETEDDEDC